jgi:hypothetical protein
VQISHTADVNLLGENVNTVKNRAEILLQTNEEIALDLKVRVDKNIM